MAVIPGRDSGGRRRSLDESARLGSELYARHIQPNLRPEDQGKFAAIDVDSGDYELDADDYTAITRLQTRRPNADVWLEMVGEPTAYRLSRAR